MRKIMTGVGLATVLALGPTAIAAAQTDEVAQEVETDDGDDNTGLFGLIGLLGLAGLAGLRRRDRPAERVTRTTDPGLR